MKGGQVSTEETWCNLLSPYLILFVCVVILEAHCTLKKDQVERSENTFL